MRIILVAAVSTDGFLTKGTKSDISGWTSAEDKQFFAEIKSKHSLYILGRKTYESVAIKPEPGILRIVMTKNPKIYQGKEVDGQLEFTDMSATEIIQKYQNNYDECLLLGGGEIYRKFLDEKSVNEMYLTVEPLIFNSGVSLFNGYGLKTFLSDYNQVSVKKLNDSGTRLYHIIV